MRRRGRVPHRADRRRAGRAGAGGAADAARRLPTAALTDRRRRARAGDPEAQEGQLLPELRRAAQRGKQALVKVVQDANVAGVSTRTVDQVGRVARAADLQAAREFVGDALESLRAPLPTMAALLEEAEEDPLAFYALRPTTGPSCARPMRVSAPRGASGRRIVAGAVTPNRRAGRGDASPAAQVCRSTASEALPRGGTRAPFATAASANRR